VREIPALRINMAITVIVAGLLKPEMPSSGVTIPNTINKMATLNATKSTGSHSMAKQMRAKNKIPRVIAIDIKIIANLETVPKENIKKRRDR
jgi:hypothetical protein